MNSLNARLIDFSVWVLASILLFSATSNADDIYVRTSGNDKNNGKTPKNAYRTIQQALKKVGSSDTIYVGAGTYTEASYLNLSSAHKKGNGILSIIGDTEGKYTGDKGTVTLQSLEKGSSWTLNLQKAHDVFLSGLSFVGNGQTSTSYGFHAGSCTGTITVEACSFQDIYQGLNFDGDAAVKVSTTSFVKNQIAVYISKSGGCNVSNSKFLDVYHGALVYSTPTLSVTSTSFHAELNKEGQSEALYPIYVTGGIAKVTSCEFSRPTHGIYGYEMAGLSVQSCTFSDPQSYAVYAQGESLSIHDSNVSSTSPKTGNGFLLADKSGKKSVLRNVSIDNVSQGIITQLGEYDFQGVTITNCNVAINFSAGTPLFVLDETAKVEFKGNDYLIYASHSVDSPGRIELRNIDLSGSTFAVLCYQTHLLAENCTFSENVYGVYAIQCPTIEVRKSRFNNIPQENSTTTGMYAQGDAITIQDCEFNGNSTGLSVHNLSKNEPELRNLICQDNTSTGLRLTSGSWNWTSKNNITLQGNVFGLIADQVDLNIDGIELRNAGTYPVYAYQGSLNVSNSVFSESGTAIYAYACDAVTCTNTVFQQMTGHGCMVYACPKTSFDGVTASQNAGFGVYCWMYSPCDFTVTNSQFLDNKSAGLRTDGISIDPAKISNLKFQRNVFGLMVYQGNLTLAPEMKLSFTENNYAAMCYYGTADIRDVKIEGNDIAFYQYGGSIAVNGSTLSAKNFGLIAYPDKEVSISQSVVRDATYGVYLYPIQDNGQKLSVTDCQFSNCSYMGIYVAEGNDSNPVLDIGNSSFEGGTYGIYGSNSTLNVGDCVFNNCTSTAIGQNFGSGRYRNVTINKTGSYGIFAYGDDFEMDASRLNNAYSGILLSTKRARVTNSIIQGGAYGVWSYNASGYNEVFNTTIANISHYPLRHDNGETLVRNSIIQSSNYGFWNTSNKGNLTHDHNVVSAKIPYLNDVAGSNEVQRDPIFMDSTAGDFRLAPGSPAINSGADLSHILLVDLEGNARPSYRQFEIGAFEFMDAAGSLRVLKWDEQAK